MILLTLLDLIIFITGIPVDEMTPSQDKLPFGMSTREVLTTNPDY